MIQTRILDGKSVAKAIREETLEEINQLQQQGLVPGLSAVVVGEDPASLLYVKSKTRTCAELRMYSETVQLPNQITTEKVIEVIHRLNHKETIDGILIQLPLPKQIDEEAVLSNVLPEKDVDGFHPQNLGKLCAGNTSLAPCTPMGIMALLRQEGIQIKGREAVVVGRSNIVGKPMALLLLQQHATVTVCHSRTRELSSVCRRADILVAAVGKAGFLTRSYLKKHVVIIDVGINRVESEEEVIKLFGRDPLRIKQIKKKGYTLVGDVHPRHPIGIAAAVTPVPGGVGPLTIAQLIKNTVTACRLRRGS